MASASSRQKRDAPLDYINRVVVASDAGSVVGSTRANAAGRRVSGHRRKSGCVGEAVRLANLGESPGVTRQYINGELSVRLAELQAVALSQESAGEAAQLRLEAEAAPLGVLPLVALRALDFMRGLCWESLARGDLGAFNRQATVGAELREFAVSARLLAED
jgi:hypothetical protein